MKPCNYIYIFLFIIETCARTDAAHFRRSTKVRSAAAGIYAGLHLCYIWYILSWSFVVGQIHEKEPLVKPLSLLDQFQRSLCHDQGSGWDRSHTNTCTVGLLGLTERISNMEQFLGVQGIVVYQHLHI